MGEATPFVLRDGDRPKVVGCLPGWLIGLPEGACLDVQISFVTYEHIVSRRVGERGWHVEMVLTRLTAVIADPSHLGDLGRPGGGLAVYRRVPGDPSGVCVCLKFLAGETWVNTAFPLGERSLRKRVARGSLREVVRPQRGLFDERLGGA